MGNLFSCAKGIQLKRPKTLKWVSSGCSTDDHLRIQNANTLLTDVMRSPSILSICDADDGSSSKESLSSCTVDAFQNEQIESLLSLHHELCPFFEIWDKLQSLGHSEYLSVCSLFYLNLSSDFITENADGFFDTSDPAKSGDFILRQINSTIIKIQDIYKLLHEPAPDATVTDKGSLAAQSVELVKRQQTFTSRSPTISKRYEVSYGVHDEIESKNKNEAIKLMGRFRGYYRIHFELGIQDTMFSETCNALTKTFDDIACSKHSEKELDFIGELSLEQRGAIRIFFEIVRALMLQHDLSEVQKNFRVSECDAAGDHIQSLMRNTDSVERFLKFWDKHFIRNMDDDQQQLFSLRIFSFMLQRLQDKAAGKYVSAANTPSVSASIDNASQIVLESLVHSLPNSNNPISANLNRAARSSNSSLLISSLILGNESSTASLNASSMTFGGNQSMNASFLTVPGSVPRSLAESHNSQLITPSPPPLQDEDIMMMFHRNESFITSFSIGIISWLNYLISFLRANEPKRLFIELKNTKRTYKRLGVDIQILNSLPFAFKSSCFVDDSFYRESSRTFYKSKTCVINEDLEESIDFVLSLFLNELTGDRDREFTSIDQNDQHSILQASPRSDGEATTTTFNSRCSPHDLSMMMGYRPHSMIQFNSPAISPSKRLRQNVFSSLFFWKTSIRIQTKTTKQKLSDKIYEVIARSAPLHQRDVISDLSSRLDCNLNIIEIIDKLLRKIESHSRDIKKPKRFAFLMGDQEMESGERQQALSTDDTDEPKECMIQQIVSDTPTHTNNLTVNTTTGRARSVHNQSKQMQLAVTGKQSRRHSAETALSKNVVVDFNSLQHDEEVKAVMELMRKHSINPMILKLFRTAVINVLSKYYSHSFDSVTKRNFTILLRTVTGLIAG